MVASSTEPELKLGEGAAPLSLRGPAGPAAISGSGDCFVAALLAMTGGGNSGDRFAACALSVTPRRWGGAWGEGGQALRIGPRIHLASGGGRRRNSTAAYR